MTKDATIEAMPETHGDRLAVKVDDRQVAEVGFAALHELVLAAIARRAQPSIQLSGSAELAVYERRHEGDSSDDGITLELGQKGCVKLKSSAAYELACVLLSYSRSDQRKQWLVRLES